VADTDLKKKLASHDIPEGFIKVTEKPLATLSSEQKAILNRKGNVLFNQGKIDEACRIFITTGYSDGLTRIGDVYMKRNQSLKALKYYILARNKAKSEQLYEKISNMLSLLLK
jgi:predicted negative regulator of RcsB-dependent stress response